MYLINNIFSTNLLFNLAILGVVLIECPLKLWDALVLTSQPFVILLFF